MARDPSFAPPASDLAFPSVGSLEVAAAPSAGQGLALSATSKIPNSSLPVPVTLPLSQHSSTFTTTQTSYTTVGTQDAGRIYLAAGQALHDSGLRPQVAVSARMQNSGAGNTTSCRAAIYELADGDTALTLLAGAGDVTLTGTTATYKNSDWTDVSVTPTKTSWMIVAEVKVSAGTGTFSALAISFRWVSA